MAVIYTDYNTTTSGDVYASSCDDSTQCITFKCATYEVHYSGLVEIPFRFVRTPPAVVRVHPTPESVESFHDPPAKRSHLLCQTLARPPPRGWALNHRLRGNQQMEPTTLEELERRFAAGERPMRLRMCRTVRSDVPGSGLRCWAGQEYLAQVNRLGAVAAVTGVGVLGLRPGEFAVVSWTANER